MLTESVTIPLEGEQALVFQEIDAEENAILAKLEPIRAKRNAMVSILLAGHSLVGEIQRTAGAKIDVTPQGGIVVSVPPRILSDGPPLIEQGASNG